jgi:hypothetical protein
VSDNWETLRKKKLDERNAPREETIDFRFEEEGDFLSGWIESVRFDFYKEGWDSPADIYTVRGESDGKLYSVFAFHKVLKDELRLLCHRTNPETKEDVFIGEGKCVGIMREGKVKNKNSVGSTVMYTVVEDKSKTKKPKGDNDIPF